MNTMRTAFTTDYGLATVDCSIRKPSDHGSMAPSRRVSPPYASFLGMNTLGIHCQLCSVVENKGGYPTSHKASRDNRLFF